MHYILYFYSIIQRDRKTRKTKFGFNEHDIYLKREFHTEKPKCTVRKKYHVPKFDTLKIIKKSYKEEKTISL